MPDAESKALNLSKSGQNVIVFMLDRAMGSYVPFIFDEKPELKEKFQGFVYYENTLSFGLCTNYGAPALFGGYEYTPAEMNKRSTELLRDKYNEALKLMPILFHNSGYHVTVCDVPYANYKEPSDLSIYDDYPDIDTYMLEGKYTFAYKALLSNAEISQKRNIVMYSVFRTVPLPLKRFVYDNGSYMTAVNAGGLYTQDFLDSYSELTALPDITGVADNAESQFLMIQNSTPHEPTALNPPDYDVDGQTAKFEFTTRTSGDRIWNIKSELAWKGYCVNVVTYEAIANWLDYLREQGVYDNTRIILAADHGYKSGQFDELKRNDGLDVQAFWPLLMVKDFNAQGSLTTSDDFMTNADVPTIAMEGVIPDPVNPFTGKTINADAKKANLYVTDSFKWGIGSNNGTAFDTEGDNWWMVHDNIFDLENWNIVSGKEVGK